MKKKLLILLCIMGILGSVVGCGSNIEKLEELNNSLEATNNLKEILEDKEIQDDLSNFETIMNEKKSNEFPYFTNNEVTVNLLTDKPEDIMSKMGYIEGEDYEVEETYTFETETTGLTYFVYDTLELYYTDISDTEYAFSGIVVYSDGWSGFNGNLHGFTTDSILTDLTNLYGDYYTYDSLEHFYFWDKTYDELNIYLSAMRDDNGELQNFSIFLPDILFTEHSSILNNMNMILEK